ncbi:hypothetical protein JW905_10080 [bacterium]|nr:hypothetical protein [candidate division CSSED10-310 bacterium]
MKRMQSLVLAMIAITATSLCVPMITAGADLLAVEDFQVKNLDPGIVAGLTTAVREHMKKLGVELLPVEKMKDIVAANSLADKCCANDEAAVERAKSYKVNQLLYGVLEQQGQSIMIHTYLVDGQSGKRLHSYSDEFIGNEEQLKLNFDKVAYKLAKHMTPSTMKVSDSAVKPGLATNAASSTEPKPAQNAPAADLSKIKPAPPPEPSTPTDPKKTGN